MSTFGSGIFGEGTFGNLNYARVIRLEPWRFFLANSDTLEILGELKQAKARTLTIDNNKSGTASGTISMKYRISTLIEEWRTCIIAQRGYQDEAQWFWSGPVSGTTKDYTNGTVSFESVGWFDLLMHRLILERVSYTDMDAAQIVSALLATANSQYPTYITMGTTEVSQLRTRTYEVDSNIGSEIQALAEIESGYDWYVDPMTRKLNIVAKRVEDRPECKWLFIANSPHKSNLRNVVEVSDGTTLTNDFYARGKFSTGHQPSPWSQDHYGVLFQEAQSLSDVPDQQILDAFAIAEIAYRESPRKTYAISPKPHTVPGVPLFGEDYEIGDVTYLTARRDFHEITEQAVRIYGVSLSIDDNGVENVTSLQTSAN